MKNSEISSCRCIPLRVRRSRASVFNNNNDNNENNSKKKNSKVTNNDETETKKTTTTQKMMTMQKLRLKKTMNQWMARQ